MAEREREGERGREREGGGGGGGGGGERGAEDDQGLGKTIFMRHF